MHCWFINALFSCSTVRILIPKLTSVEDCGCKSTSSSDNRSSPDISVYVLTLLSLLALYSLCISHENNSQLPSSVEEPLCSLHDKMAELARLVLRVHDSLNDLRVPHFLCYSTLWGAVYIGSVFPWDRTVHLCVLEEDISRVDEALLHETFRRAGIDSFYSSFHGHYNLKLRQAHGTLTVFRKVAGKRVKAGLDSWLLVLFHKEVGSFPDRLLETPFANVSFYGHKFLVPELSVNFIKTASPSEVLRMTQQLNLQRWNKESSNSL